MNVRLELEDVGSEGYGAVGCAAAVDAAIDVIVGRGLAQGFNPFTKGFCKRHLSVGSLACNDIHF